MIKKPNHASDEQLRVLLFEVQENEDTARIAAHVETCELCQSKLSQLVDTDLIAVEASQLLSGITRFEEDTSRSTRSSRAEEQKEVDSEFDAIVLGPPSHPEMLGRVDRYEIERRIGSGGMGIVFKAIDTELHRPVAIKFLAPYLARNGAARQRFGRESRAAAAVVHEHVVAIHNVDSNCEYPYLVMQYVSGESLQARVDRMGPLAVDQILRIGIQTASGLEAAHQQGIVHRDVKPANILLEESVERVLLTDFGLARTVDDASLTQTGIVAGTPNYMSPEQANGDTVDHRSDLFSLGTVLYFVATGHPPFRAERAMGVLHRICHARHRPVWEINNSVPDELSELIDRLLEKRPSKRFSSAAAVQVALTRILQETQQRRFRMGSQIRSWSRRHPSASWGMALVLMITAAAVFVFPAAWRSFSKPTLDSTSISKTPPFPDLKESPPLELRTNSMPTNEDFLQRESNEFLGELNQLQQSLNQLERYSTDPNENAVQAFVSELQAIEKVLITIDPSTQPIQ